MKHALVKIGCAAIVVAFGLTPAAAVKKTPYPEVKVELADAFQPDAAFTTMVKALRSAIEKKDATALFALVAPSFLITFAGGANADFDPGRDAMHNFKVAFGFRAPDKDVDGGVEGGPFWESLADFARETTYYRPPNTSNLVCSPIAADVADESVYEQANTKVESPDEDVEWYVTLADTPVTKAPEDKGAPVARIGRMALPVLNTHPPAPADGTAISFTHIEVLLPSGKTGWVPMTVAVPLQANRLCFAKTPNGEWKIAGLDQNRD